MTARSRAEEERKEIIRRFLGLPERDRLGVFGELREFIAADLGSHDPLEEKLQRRREALEAKRRVAEDLRARGMLKADAAPTVAQFDEAAGRLKVGWSSSGVIRAFTTWRNAKAALLGGRVRNAPGERRSRRQAGVRSRTRQEHVESTSALRTTAV